MSLSQHRQWCSFGDDVAVCHTAASCSERWRHLPATGQLHPRRGKGTIPQSRAVRPAASAGSQAVSHVRALNCELHQAPPATSSPQSTWPDVQLLGSLYVAQQEELQNGQKQKSRPGGWGSCSLFAYHHTCERDRCEWRRGQVLTYKRQQVVIQQAG